MDAWTVIAKKTAARSPHAHCGGVSEVLRKAKARADFQERGGPPPDTHQTKRLRKRSSVRVASGTERCRRKIGHVLAETPNKSRP
jgi:hypothetical protein